MTRLMVGDVVVLSAMISSDRRVWPCVGRMDRLVPEGSIGLVLKEPTDDRPWMFVLIDLGMYLVFLDEMRHA